MGNSTAVRHLVDLLMTVVLVLLMAYFRTDAGTVHRPSHPEPQMA